MGLVLSNSNFFFLTKFPREGHLILKKVLTYSYKFGLKRTGMMSINILLLLNLSMYKFQLRLPFLPSFQTQPQGQHQLHLQQPQQQQQRHQLHQCKIFSAILMGSVRLVKDFQISVFLNSRFLKIRKNFLFREPS